MSQVPPPGGYANQPPFPQQPMPPQGPRTNGAAVASLICGILGCIPVITSLAAIVLGIVGIRKASQPQTGGKGLAIGGLILGVIGLLVWVGIGVSGYYGVRYVKDKMLQPAESASTAFINTLASGDIATAKNFTTGDLTEAELSSLGEQLKSYGKLNDLSLNQFNADSIGGNSFRITMGGSASFENATKGFSATLVGSMDGEFKVEDFKLR